MGANPLDAVRTTACALTLREFDWELFMPFSTLQKLFHGLTDQIRAGFVVFKHGIHAGKGAFGKRSLHFLGPQLFSSHTNYFPYGLLTTDKSYGICRAQSRKREAKPMLKCDMCHKPLKANRHQIVSGDRTLTVGPECFKKEKAAADRLANPDFQSFKTWMTENKGGARPCPAGAFPRNFQYWCEGGRW